MDIIDIYKKKYLKYKQKYLNNKITNNISIYNNNLIKAITCFNGEYKRNGSI